MLTFWILSTSLLVFFTLLLGKFSLKYYKKNISEKTWKQQGLRTRYWQGIILAGFILTCITIYILKLTDLLVL